MTEALQLRKIAVERIAAQNSLYRGGLRVAFRWLDLDWDCRLQPVRAMREQGIRIVADWGGTEAILLADFAWLEWATQALLNESDISALPAQLQAAMLETAFSEIADQIEAASKKPFRIKKLQLLSRHANAEIELRQAEAIEWAAECDGQAFRGGLLLDATGVMFASIAARNRKHDEYEGLRLHSIPIPFRFVIGTTNIPLSAFTSIQVRDVIVLDESRLQHRENLTVSVANNAVFHARLSGTCLVVTEGLANIMDDSYDENDFATDEIIADLPVKLTFDLGERVMPLGELQMIAPGYVFDLGRDLRQAVIIRANGMRIGEGELIDIEGRTGVAVLTITGLLE